MSRSRRATRATNSKKVETSPSRQPLPCASSTLFYRETIARGDESGSVSNSSRKMREHTSFRRRANAVGARAVVRRRWIYDEYGFKTSRAPRRERFKTRTKRGESPRIGHGERTFNLLRIGIVVHGVRRTGSATMCGGAVWTSGSKLDRYGENNTETGSVGCLDYYNKES